MSRAGLEARAPEKGRAADCYAVARTAGHLRDHAKPSGVDGMSNLRAVECARHASELHRISGALHRIDLAEANGGTDCQTCKGEGAVSGFADGTCGACLGTGQRHAKKEHRLRAAANEIAELYGLRAYFQGDCRGCALYLIDMAAVPVDRETLARYVYPSDKGGEDLRSRWIEANYDRGHAVVRLRASNSTGPGAWFHGWDVIPGAKE